MQLNTLDLTRSDGVKNIFWQQPLSVQKDEEDPANDPNRFAVWKREAMLFDTCEFVKARPAFEGFNPKVFRTIQAMYKQK
jgi:hypothetical protein